MIRDTYNRVHDYLRISLTDNCDLRCVYCMPEEEYQFTAAARLMQAAEIEAIARQFVEEGVRKIRLTGGEPLVRKDFKLILERLSRLSVELTMTTNGVRLHEFVDEILSSGMRAVNISLDTLRPERFLMITKRDKHEIVLKNIRLMLEKEIRVKVNVVVMKGINEDELNNFIEMTRELPLEIRFIEFMPFDRNKWNSDRVVSLAQILETISNVYSILPMDRKAHETTKKYKVPGFRGNFAVISTMTAPFCSDCNRMRLTADGKMKNCLFSEAEVDLLSAYRKGKDISPLIHQCIKDKHESLGGQFVPFPESIHAEELHNRTMIRIGG